MATHYVDTFVTQIPQSHIWFVADHPSGPLIVAFKGRTAKSGKVSPPRVYTYRNVPRIIRRRLRRSPDGHTFHRILRSLALTPDVAEGPLDVYFDRWL